MRSAEVSPFGVHMALIVPVVLATWIEPSALRRMAARFGVLGRASPPAICVLSVPITVLSFLVPPTAFGGLDADPTQRGVAPLNQLTWKP